MLAIKMTIAHEKGRIIVDTGSPISFGEIAEIEICGNTHKLSSNILLDEIRKHAGEDIVGLLGMDILSKYDLETSINRQGNRFAINFSQQVAERLEVVLSKEIKHIAMEYLMGIPVLSLELNGATRKFFLDTGAGISYIKEELIAGQRNVGKKSDFYPLLGNFEAEAYQVKASLAGLEFNSEMCILPGLLKLLLIDGIDGILGADVLSKFKVFLGFKSKIFKVEKIEKNDFVDILMEASTKNWCCRLFCTTCGCGEYREALRKLGYEHVLQEMSKLKMSDISHISKYKEYINVAAYDMQGILALMPEERRPEIIIEIKEKVRDIFVAKERRVRRNEVRVAELRINNSELKKEKVARRKELCSQKKQDRYVALKLFMQLSISNQLAFLAHDPLHKSDYYQLDLAKIPDEALLALDTEVKNLLINKFATYTKKTYRDFHQRLVISQTT